MTVIGSLLKSMMSLWGSCSTKYNFSPDEQILNLVRELSVTAKIRVSLYHNMLFVVVVHMVLVESKTDFSLGSLPSIL